VQSAVSGNSANPLLLHLARWVSIIAHPIVLLIVMIGLAGNDHPELSRPGSILFLLAAGILPILVLMERMFRTGRWKTRDASEKRERPIVYVVALGSVCVLLVWALVQQIWSLVPGLAALGILLGIGLAALRWLKMSFHLSIAAFVGGALFEDARMVSLAVLAVLPLLAWSRLVLKKHTLREVLVGAGLGLVAGAAAVATGD